MPGSYRSLIGDGALSHNELVPKAIKFANAGFVIGHNGFKRSPEPSRMIALKHLADFGRYHAIHMALRGYD
jgi:hypothetical protein